MFIEYYCIDILKIDISNSSSMQIFSRKETVANNTISIESKDNSSEVCSYTVTDDISCVVNFTASIDVNANGNREVIYNLYRDGVEYSLYLDRCQALSGNWGYLNSYTLPLKLKAGDKLAINCVQNSGSALSAVGVITFFK